MTRKKSLKKYFSHSKTGRGSGMLRNNMLRLHYFLRPSITNLDDAVPQMGFYDTNINFTQVKD